MVFAALLDISNRKSEAPETIEGALQFRVTSAQDASRVAVKDCGFSRREFIGFTILRGSKGFVQLFPELPFPYCPSILTLTAV